MAADSLPSQPSTVEAFAQSRPGAFERFALSVMQVTSWQQRSVAGTKASSQIRFQFMAITIGAIAFAGSSTAFVKWLLNYEWLQAVFMGAMTGVGLWLLDRYTLVDRRGNLDAGVAKVWMVRVASVVLLFGVGVLVGVHSHRKDIDRIKSAQTQDAARALQADPRYASQLSAADKAVQQASEDVSRLAVVKTERAQQFVRFSQADAEYQRECKGAIGANGKRYRKGCGAAADGQAIERDDAQRQMNALDAEATALGNPTERLAQARQDLAALQNQIAQESGAAQQGAARDVEALMTLLSTEWPARFTLGFWILLGLVPESLVWMALARTDTVDNAFEGLNELEDRRIQAVTRLLAHQMKQELARQARPMEVHLNTAVVQPIQAGASPAAAPHATAHPSTGPVPTWLGVAPQPI